MRVVAATIATITLKAMMGPVGWVQIAVGVGVAAVAINELKHNLGGAADEMKRLNDEKGKTYHYLSGPNATEDFFSLLGGRNKPKLDIQKMWGGVTPTAEGPQTENEKKRWDVLKNIRAEADRIRAGGPLGEYLQ